MTGKRLTFAFVKEFFDSKGCKLISEDYENARTHLDYRCSCGNLSTIIFDSFRRGHRCNKCGNKKAIDKQRPSIDYIKNFFEENGCLLISTEYKKAGSILDFKCKCGKISKITFNNFRERKRCGKCGTQARSGENHYEWVSDRNKKAEEDKLKQRCYKILRYPFVLINKNKNVRNIDLYGYDTQNLISHIKNHDNWEIVKNNEWHIDHIFPIKAFLDFKIYDPKLINSLDNLQPVLKIYNLKKNDYYDKNEFLMWIEKKKYLMYEMV